MLRKAIAAVQSGLGSHVEVSHPIASIVEGIFAGVAQPTRSSLKCQ
jgi:hypothetical protein